MRNAEKWGLALPLWQKRSKVDAYWSKWCKRQHAEGANKHVMDASVLLSPSTHVNAVSASSPKVTCVSLGLSSRLRAPSLACRPSEQPCRPQLTVRTASSSDREEARPAAMKRQDGWRQTEGWRSRKVREKKKKKRPSSRGVSQFRVYPVPNRTLTSSGRTRELGTRKIRPGVIQGRWSFQWLKQTAVISEGCWRGEIEL